MNYKNVKEEPRNMFSSGPNRWLVLLAIMVAFLPIVLDMTILHVAVPSLTMALEASGSEILWIIDIYPLMMASLLIPMGTLADKIGHRRLLLLGLSIFLVGSALAAFSPTAAALIGARAFMAIGAAMAMPCTLAIIRQTFEDERERAIAIGSWGAVASAGAAVGPLVGGFLLEYFWWGSVFLVNVPLILVVIPLVVILVPRRAIVGKGDWRVGQALVLMGGIMATVYAIKSGFKPEVSVVLTSMTLLVGVSMLAWFTLKQLNSTHPMLDMSLFSRPAITAGVVMALVVGGSLAGVELMLAQELQFVLGYTPLQAGMFMLPLMLGALIGGPFAGFVLGLVGLRTVASLSLLIAAVSLTGLAYSSFHEPSVGVIALLTVLGLSLGIGLTASSVAIMSSTPVEKAGAGGALEATSYDLGTGLGITLFGLLLTAIYGKAIRIPENMPDEVSAAAIRSIGEAMMAARSLDGDRETALLNAAREAFSVSHSVVLLSAAVLIGLMGVCVVFLLKNYRKLGDER